VVLLLALETRADRRISAQADKKFFALLRKHFTYVEVTRLAIAVHRMIPFLTTGTHRSTTTRPARLILASPSFSIGSVVRLVYRELRRLKEGSIGLDSSCGRTAFFPPPPPSCFTK
jgi:hypothetical protein